jgi:hypothetical protein
MQSFELLAPADLPLPSFLLFIDAPTVRPRDPTGASILASAYIYPLLLLAQMFRILIELAKIAAHFTPTKEFLWPFECGG